jgi:hypothetical protein
LTELLILAGHEVYVITGSEDTPLFRKKLKDLKIQYTEVFSITSYHKFIGTKIKLDKKGNPWMSRKIWDKTKAWYCKKKKINLHIDDSEIYGKYFTTPYLLFTRGKK